MPTIAEKRNEEGRQAFQAGDFARAALCYEAAIAADPSSAKYYTNFANTLLKLDRIAEAGDAAQSAIDADPKWIKGYYFCALAKDRAGQFTRGLDHCARGLGVDSTNTELQSLQKTIQQHKKQLRQLEEQESKRLKRPQRAVRYNARILDCDGSTQEQSFSFVQTFDAARVQEAITDIAVGQQLIQELVMPHYREMLNAKPWGCIGCHKPAKKLLLNPGAYLHLPEPLLFDLMPSPCCGAPQCMAYCYEQPRKMLAEIDEEMGTPSTTRDGGMVTSF
jgi:tetratricopeptide (TPR) repeat protein